MIEHKECVNGVNHVHWPWAVMPGFVSHPGEQTVKEKAYVIIIIKKYHPIWLKQNSPIEGNPRDYVYL